MSVIRCIRAMCDAGIPSIVRDNREDKIDERRTNEKVDVCSMRHFFKPKKYSDGQKWQSILDEDNSKAFEVEMTQTLINVNRFITKIEIESLKLNQIRELKKENEKKFKDYLITGRELLTKLKTLAILEKASAMEKYEQSHVRKLSYAATEDTASGVDTESVVDGHGTFGREESFNRRDSTMLTLVHKYASTFTKQYEILEKLNHDVEESVERFDIVLDFIHQRLQQRLPLPSVDTRHENEHFLKINFSLDGLPAVDEDFTTTIDDNTKSAVDILSEHFRNSPINTVTYKHLSASGSGHLVEHTFCCFVGSLYAEGKSRKKSKAKEEAATEMIKQIVKRQKSSNLPSNIPPFNELWLHELVIKLTDKEDFVEKLEEKCLHSHEPPPLYSIISESEKNNEPYYAAKCEAMGFTALGYASEKLQAKKNAAKSILNIVTKRRKLSNT